jgi:hypothetical protein
MSVWDQIILLDAEASATPGGVTSLEIPPTADQVNVQVAQSGTASTVVVQGSVDDSLWYQIAKIETSATLHGVTVVPRYIRAITSATADSQITVTLQYRK